MAQEGLRAHIRAEYFHLWVVSEAEEFSTAQMREFTKVRRQHKQKLDCCDKSRTDLETERENLRMKLKLKESQLERQSAKLDAQPTELAAQTAVRNRHALAAAGLRKQLADSEIRLGAVNDYTAKTEVKVKTSQGLVWRARRIRRTFKR